NPVMHHLDEMPGACRTGVDVATLSAAVAFGAARCRRNIAEPRRERGEDRIEMVHRLFLTPNHHAVAAIDTPHAARRAAIDIANAFRGQFSGAADIVFVK